MKMTRKKRITDSIIYIVMIGFSITMLFPFFWMLSTSFKTKQDAISIVISLIPRPISFDAYIEVWQRVPLLSGFKNTMLMEIPEIVVGTFTSAMAAFAFAKMNFPLKKYLFFGLLTTMMLPGLITLIPTYVFWGNIGITDSLLPLILPAMFGNVSMMFFLRQFLDGIPNDFIGAAQIDGAGWMQTFVRVFLPLMKPGIAAQIIFWFMSIWNGFLAPLIYLDSENKYTLQLSLRLLDSLCSGTMDFPVLMAGAVLSCIPLIIVFICGQKYFVDSQVASGIKG